MQGSKKSNAEASTSQRVCDSLAKRHGMSPGLVRILLNEAFEAIERETLSTGRCHFRGFGTFKLQQQAAKKGRVVRTGEPVLIPARSRIVFAHGRDRRRTVDESGREPRKDGGQACG